MHLKHNMNAIILVILFMSGIILDKNAFEAQSLSRDQSTKITFVFAQVKFSNFVDIKEHKF